MSRYAYQEASWLVPASTFERINRNARKLSAQKLRHAKYDGWFSSTAETEADRSEWKDFGIATTARSKRMLDVQFVSELMQVVINERLAGFDQNTIDDIYADYDDLADVPDSLEYDFWLKFQDAKNFIQECINVEKSLLSYLKVQMHFYSLWGYLILSEHRRLTASEFVPRYLQLLRDAASYNENPMLLDTADPAELQAYQGAVGEYATNARGAITDLTQRWGRHAALINAIPAPGVAGHEDP